MRHLPIWTMSGMFGPIGMFVIVKAPAASVMALTRGAAYQLVQLAQEAPAGSAGTGASGT